MSEKSLAFASQSLGQTLFLSRSPHYFFGVLAVLLITALYGDSCWFSWSSSISKCWKSFFGPVHRKNLCLSGLGNFILQGLAGQFPWYFFKVSQQLARLLPAKSNCLSSSSIIVLEIADWSFARDKAPLSPVKVGLDIRIGIFSVVDQLSLLDCQDLADDVWLDIVLGQVVWLPWQFFAWRR